MKLKVAVTIFAILFTAASLGKSRITLEETINIESDSAVYINIPVGSLEVETYDGDEIVLEVELKESDEGWFKSVDFDDAEIDIRQSGDKIHLEVDMEDVVQNWQVKLPESASLDIDLGVGQVNIEDFHQDANIDVGVGEVDVQLADDNYREIDLDSGVGGADLRGFKNVDRERAMISETVNWQGKGDFDLTIDVGVGDIEVRH